LNEGSKIAGRFETRNEPGNDQHLAMSLSEVFNTNFKRMKKFLAIFLNSCRNAFVPDSAGFAWCKTERETASKWHESGRLR
jgi:hypothetical protein